MRILLTPLGQDEIRVIGEQSQQIILERLDKSQSILNRSNNLKKNKDSRIHHSYLNTSFGTNSLHNTKSFSNRHKTDLLSKLEMDQTTISIDELSKSKEISLKQKKLNISKAVTDKYNTDIPTLPEVTMESNYILPILNSNIKGKLSLKKVLKESSYNLLKSDHIRQKNIRDRSSRIDETQFRSIYEQHNHMEKLDQILNKKLNPDRVNLIRYLNEKEKISEILIKKIYDYDEEKINKMNKICQMVIHNNDISKLTDGIIRNKIDLSKNKEKEEYRNEIDHIGYYMNGITDILKNYNKKTKDRERFREVHNDVVKNYWLKHEVEHISRKVSPRNKNILTNTSTVDYYSRKVKK